MMTLNDLDALNRDHDIAVCEMGRCAVAIAEAVVAGKRPDRDAVSDYKAARLGVESTRRDLEYCMSLALAEIMDK